MIVGNKSDLKHWRAVGNDIGQEYAKSKNFAFLEASALDDNNVEAAFTQILQYKNMEYNLLEIYQNLTQQIQKQDEPIYV